MSIIQRLKKIMNLNGGPKLSILEIIGSAVIFFIAVVLFMVIARYLILWAIIVGAGYLFLRLIVGLGGNRK